MLGVLGVVVLLILIVVVDTLRENNWLQPRITQARVRHMLASLPGRYYSVLLGALHAYRDSLY